MQINTNNTRQINTNVMEGQEQKVMFYANFKPGKSLNITLEAIDEAYAAQHKQEIADAFDAFMADALHQAYSCNVPVNPVLLDVEACADAGGGTDADESALAPAT